MRTAHARDAGSTGPIPSGRFRPDGMCSRVRAMDLLDHVLQRMGRHATALLPFSLLVGVVFQDLAAAARPLVGPLATLLLMLALVRTDWPRVRALLQRPALALVLSA